MVDINLHQAAERELRIKKSTSVFKSSPFISLSLLVIVLAIFGATKLYQMSLSSKYAELVQEKKSELESIDKDAVNELVDFQERMSASMKNLTNKRYPKETLTSIEGMVVKGVFLNSLKQNGELQKIEMDAVSDTFKSAASQMLSFKRSDMFTDVRITKSGRDQDGRATFSLEADLKTDLKK